MDAEWPECFRLTAPPQPLPIVDTLRASPAAAIDPVRYPTVRSNSNSVKRRIDNARVMLIISSKVLAKTGH